MVALGKLVAFHEDFGGYINYVFEVLDDEIRRKTKYILCTRFPNWECKSIKIGDKGYLEYEEIEAGVTTWFDKDRNIQVPYKYDMIQFIKFIELPSEDNKEEYIL